MALGSNIAATSSGSAPISTAMSATGLPVLSASAATAEASLYPSTGSRFVTTPMDPRTSSAHRRSFASIPSTHRVRSVSSALVISPRTLSRLNTMTGSKTFSWSCPASLAAAMVASAPMTWKHTWFTTSGMTGLIFPGMMLDPGAAGGSAISPNPHRGPELNRRRSLHILDVFTATRRRMLLNSRNAPVLELASTKSVGERSGNPVSSANAATASAEKRGSAQIFVPIAVPPTLSSYSWSTLRAMNVASASRLLANAWNS